MSRTRIVLLGVTMLALALIACAIPGASAQPTPTLYVIPTQPPDADAPTAPPDSGDATQPAEGADTGGATGGGTSADATPSYPYFDPCNLITQAEAEALLGGPVQGDTFGIAAAFGGCYYGLQDGSKNVTVGALYDEDARGLLMLGAGMALISDDESIKAAATDLLARAATMSLDQIMDEMMTNPVWQSEADDPTPEAVPGVGDTAYWTWVEADLEGEFLVVSGDQYVSVGIDGFDEATARANGQQLAETALDRLPADPYTTLNPPTPEPTP